MSPSAGAAALQSVPLRSGAPQQEVRRASTLWLVPQRRSSAAKAPFVVVVVLLLVGGLLGLLLLNTLVAQDSFALHKLAATGKSLELREQDLSRQVQALQAPAALAARATALGMVPGGPPAFLQLPSGRVLGQPMPGVAAPLVKPVVKPVVKPDVKAAANPGVTPAPKPAGTSAVKPAPQPSPGPSR